MSVIGFLGEPKQSCLPTLTDLGGRLRPVQHALSAREAILVLVHIVML